MKVHQGAARVDALRLGPVQKRLEVAGAELLLLAGRVHVCECVRSVYVCRKGGGTELSSRPINTKTRTLEKGCAGLAVDLASW